MQKQPQIYSSENLFDLAQLHLANPVVLNGSHFIKTLVGYDTPLYVQTPRCSVKQGFVASGKKTVCDLVLNNADADFLRWLKSLEETVCSGLFKNREKWFETELSETDIENSMSPLYIQKQKHYIVRVHVPTFLGKISIKIFDENEQEVPHENVTDNTQVIAVLEIQGVKCNARGFHFELELKQMLLVQPEKLFEKCIIGKPLSAKSSSVSAPAPAPVPMVVDETPSLVLCEESPEKAVDDNVVVPAAEKEPPVVLETETEPQQHEQHLIGRALEPNENVTENAELVESVNVMEPVEIADLELSLGNLEEVPPVQLKKRDDVYYTLYREERAKAREAKQVALAHYLEAKRIKNEHFLEEVSDSDEEEGFQEFVNL